MATTKLSVGKRRVSVEVPVNLKTRSCQQLLYYDFVSAALWPTDDLPRKSEAHSLNYFMAYRVYLSDYLPLDIGTTAAYLSTGANQFALKILKLFI